MPKRSTTYPSRQSEGEYKLNTSKQYDKYIKQPSNVKPVFLEDHYGVKKGAAKDE